MKLALYILLDLCHWLVISCAWILLGRAFSDVTSMVSPRIKARMLPIDNFLATLTDPVLDPIRDILRGRIPSWLDPSPFIAILGCLAVDFLIVCVKSKL